MHTAMEWVNRASPVALALLVWIVRAKGPAWSRKLPPWAVPWVSMALGGLWGALGPGGQADVNALIGALDGAIGTGLAASGVWGLTAAARKRPRKPATP